MINLFIVILLLLFPLNSQAAGFLDSVPCINSGVCGLDDIALGFNALIRALLGLMGAVSLLYFVWGGIIWISSAGNMEKVSRGKNIMINTILAILVAFSSYLILDLFVNKLLGAKNSTGNIVIECEQAQDDGRQCNAPQDNYECYQRSCLTRCEIANQKLRAGSPPQGFAIPSDYSLACEDVRTFPDVNLVFAIQHLCPGNNNMLCVLRDPDDKTVPINFPF